MPAADSPAIIVAKYLKANDYNESYKAFVNEAGLPIDAGNPSKGDLTLEALLEEKKTFDLAVSFEKLGVDESNSVWRLPAPSVAKNIDTLPTSSNILSARVEHFSNAADGSLESILTCSTADRRLHVVDAKNGTLRASLSDLHDAPILSSSRFGRKQLLSTSMSGQLVLSDLTGKILDKRRDHTKFAVKVVSTEDMSGASVVATAGWDAKVLLYKPSPGQLHEPLSTITLPTKPESIAFIKHPHNDEPVLLVSRTDSNCLFFYTVEQPPRLLGQQNLAPHSNAWVAFTPSAFELCPTDPTVLAVGTSSVPHMKLLIVQLLFPPWDEQRALPTQGVRNSLLDDTTTSETQASQARAALAVADREFAAIKIHCTTMAPQTAYSTPAVAWRPDGSGIFVNGDDGTIRGIEASTGKVVSTLQGHEAGSKVRCLWAGLQHGECGQEEVLVSGGFDQKLIVWHV